MTENEQLETLKRLIEQTIGRKVKSPKDFTFLASRIFDKMGETLSTSTLKRLWGYLPGYATIRPSTLDLLARFVGYSDWDQFLEQQQQQTPDCEQSPESGTPSSDSGTPPDSEQSPESDIPSDSEQSPESDTPSDSAPSPKRATSFLSFRRALLIGAALLVLVAGVALLFSPLSSFLSPLSSIVSPLSSADRYELRTGEVFATNAAYLSLFGIEPGTSWWDEPLPHHEGVYIWGPEYQNPQWHNEGQRDSLMPTITEYYTPAEGLSPTDSLAVALTAEKNRSRLFFAQRYDELRITFMKNLTDTGYVFLGVYRIDRNASDSTRLVWQRVADELDLRHLDRLEQLR